METLLNLVKLWQPRKEIFYFHCSGAASNPAKFPSFCRRLCFDGRKQPDGDSSWDHSTSCKDGEKLKLLC